MKSIKTILHKLADEFDSNATAANQSDISHTWGFAASELRLAAAQLPEAVPVRAIAGLNGKDKGDYYTDQEQAVRASISDLKRRLASLEAKLEQMQK